MSIQKEPHSLQDLIKQYNDINQIEADKTTLSHTLKKATLLCNLAQHSKKDSEQHHFIMQAIGILEALSMQHKEQDVTDTKDDKNNQYISTEDYRSITLLLAQCYIDLSNNKKETKLLSIPKKLLKPLVHQQDIEATQLLIRVCSLKDEPALCQFYIKKMLAFTHFKGLDLTGISALTKYQHTDWFTELK